MRDDDTMRTTLDLDDDILLAVKELAQARGTTAGKVLSDLARLGLEPKGGAKVRNGVPLLPRGRRGARKLTMSRVNELRDQP